MTRAQALAEAWRRWGSMGPPRVYTYATRHRKSPLYRVGIHGGAIRGVSNESWEDAFKTAKEQGE